MRRSIRSGHDRNTCRRGRTLLRAGSKRRSTRPTTAGAHLRRATYGSISISEAASIGDHYHQASALNDLGMGGLVSNRFDEALSRFEPVLRLTDLEPFTIYSVSLYNAGICYAQLGEYERAA